MQLSEFSIADIDALLAHSQQIGWYDRQDWLCFLSNGLVFGHKHQGRIVSSAFVSNYDNILGWLGAFIVAPDFQKKGLGKELIEYCKNVQKRFGFVLALVSTEEGKSLYESAGFKTVTHTFKFVADDTQNINSESNKNSCLVRLLSEADFDKVAVLDKIALNADRKALVHYRMNMSGRNFGSFDEHGRLSGFVFGALDGGNRLLVGPLIAESADGALALIHEVCRGWNGPIRMDIPKWQPHLIEAIATQGLTLERQCPLMTLDGRALPLESNHYFALMAQALG